MRTRTSGTPPVAVNTGRRPGAGTWRMVAALLRQRRRLALATVAIAIGVGYLAGALTLLDRVSEGLDDLAAAGAERADLVVEGEVAYESALEQTRRLVPSTVAPAVRAVPGVASVSPRVEEITLLLDAEGVPLVAPGLSEQPLGTNWPEDDAMSPYRFVGDGRPPAAPDEVVIDVASAERAEVSVGDSIVAVGRTGPALYSVVGIVTTAEGPLPAGSSLALFTTERAREIFEAQDNDNRVAILVEEGEDLATVEARIRDVLPAGSELVDGETAAQHRQENLTRSFALIRVLIMGFAGLALVVGMITVSNSLTLLYAQRRRTLAAFRLVGAKPRQLMGVALIEAALLAAVASLVGAPLGLAFGRFIEAVLGSLGTSVPVGGSALSWSALGTAVLVGAATTILAAVMPARRACSVAPVEAVVEAPSDPVSSPWQRLLDATIVAVTIGVAVAGLLVLFDVEARVGLLVGLAAIVAVVVMATLPWVLAAAVAAGISVVPLRPVTLRRIGARDAVRHRTRTAATTGALMLATAVVSGLAVFLASFAASLDGDVGRLVVSDVVVDSGTFTRGGLPAELLAETAALDEVDAVSGWQVGRGTVGHLGVRLTGVDGAVLEQVLSPGWVGPAPQRFAPDEVLLFADTAAALGASVGDIVPVVFTSQGVEMLSVAGIYDRGSVLLGEVVVDRSTLMRQVPASVDIAALVSLSEDTAAARAAVTELAETYGVTSVLPPEEFVDRRSDLLRGFERVIQWMLFFTLVQALVGVVNTLLLSVGERRREFGLLRAAGAGARQVQRLVLAEGLSFAVIGTVLGIVLGVIGGAAAMRALGRFGIEGLAVPILPLLVTALAAVALGVAAAVVPARWAAAVPPLEAVADTGSAPVRAAMRLRESVAARQPGAPFPTGAPAPGGVPTPSGAPIPSGVQTAAGTPSPGSPLFTPAAGAASSAAPKESLRPPPYRRDTAGSGSWVKDPSRAAAGGGTGAPGPGQPRHVFARAPRPDAPSAPPGHRPVPGWRVAGDAVPSDEVAWIRLSDAMERLDPATASDARPALVPLARALDADEDVRAMVQGWAKGLLCLVVRTDRRLLVVVDRFPDPLVESLDPDTTRVQLFGPPGADKVSVSVVDGRRLLEVAGVRDPAEAEALQRHDAAAPAGQATPSGYF